MEKKPYYISVQARTITEDQGDTGYELEINATPDEIERLNSMFEDMSYFDNGSFLKAHLYAYPYSIDPENDGYDYYLRDVYQFLYELGTSETKQHIENAKLLNLEENNGYS
jgi:hypothetical protein